MYCYYSVLDNEYDKPSLIPLFTKSTYVLRESTIVQQQCSVFGNIVVPKKISRFAQSVYQFHRFFLKRNDYVSSTTLSEGYLTRHHL